MMVRDEIQIAAMGYLAQVWEDTFEIHNVKEDDYRLVMDALSNIVGVSNITNSFRYDYGTAWIGMAKKIYTIRGSFIEKAKTKKKNK